MPRGRPRSDSAMTTAERKAKSRAGRPRKREVTLLSPEANARADAMIDHEERGFSGLVERLILAGEP